MTRSSRLLVAVIILAAWPAVASAQVDLSGVWIRQPAGNGFGDTPPPPMTPWALERFAAHKPTVGPKAALDANDPTLDCAAPGVPYILAVPTPFEFVHAPGQVIQLFEYNHFVRRIHTDGRPHPANLRDTGSYEWMGHSIGRWEGSVFVIDTIGFNDATWLDRLGHPHSDALHVVERLRRLDHETLEYEVTVEDPKAYTAPWTGRMVFKLRSDWEILEHSCTNRGDAYLGFKAKAWAPGPQTPTR
jgi:hypothetical protein